MKFLKSQEELADILMTVHFGITGQCESLSADEIEKLEKHELSNINVIYWRNSELNFESLDNLINSLEKKI